MIELGLLLGRDEMEISVDAGTLIHSSLVAVFYLAVLIILWTLCSNKLTLLWKQFQRTPESKRKTIPSEVHKELQEASIRRIDEKHKTKAAEYEERVLRPREEAKKREREKEFRRFAGPAWKGEAQPLGDPKDDDENNGRRGLRRRVDGTSRDAADIRKLPETKRKSEKEVTTTPEKVPQPKRVIILPEEPEEGTPGTVTIALRGLNNLKRRRRFLTEEKVQVLMDWMVKVGYHSKLYTLCTTYPRRDLSTMTEQSLRETGIIHDVVVFVEEREDHVR